MPDRADRASREVEVTLTLQAGDRDAAFADLRDLDVVGGYELGPSRRIDLRDLYFDTPAGTLRAAGFALRLRWSGAKVALALKGPPRALPGGALDRFESEAPWSDSFLEDSLTTLRGLGVSLGSTSTVPEGGTPEEVLHDLGLLAVHEREIERERRYAVPVVVEQRDPVAEIDLDTVSFPLRRRRVVHQEIEIEGRGPEAGSYAADIAAAIGARLGEALRPWPFGKLTTGRALEALEAEGRLDPFLDDRGRVGQDGYDLVEARIRSWRAPSVET